MASFYARSCLFISFVCSNSDQYWLIGCWLVLSFVSNHINFCWVLENRSRLFLPVGCLFVIGSSNLFILNWILEKYSLLFLAAVFLFLFLKVYSFVWSHLGKPVLPVPGCQLFVFCLLLADFTCSWLPAVFFFFFFFCYSYLLSQIGKPVSPALGCWLPEN